MQAFTVTQWAIVALVFVAGWLLGLASHPGGRKWRERYAAERDAHAAYRRDHDARVATARTDADARVAELEARNKELEREHARLVAAAPMTAGTVTPATQPPTSVQTAARPALAGTRTDAPVKREVSTDGRFERLTWADGSVEERQI